MRIYSFRELLESILSSVTSEHVFMRKSASAAVGKLCEEFPKILQQALDELDLLYSDYRKVCFHLFLISSGVIHLLLMSFVFFHHCG